VCRPLLVVTLEAAYHRGSRVLGRPPARRSSGKREIIVLVAETFDLEPALGFMASARVCGRDSKIFGSEAKNNANYQAATVRPCVNRAAPQ
jgi:hypothetical protein